jgi:uncharacterized damage-inducible protein DinB
MLVTALRTVYDFQRWANAQILDTAAALTPEQLHRPGTAGHGSVRDTLLHMFSAHAGWLGLCDGSLSAAQAFSDEPPADDYPDVAALRAFWRSVDAATQAYLARLDDAEAASERGGTFPWDGSTFSTRVWTILLHIANHSTEHRSEVAAMLTDAGCSPGDLGFMGFALGRAGEG